MDAAAAALLVAPALALGSFLNVVVARVPARRSLLRPPSSCGSCSTAILWRDNVPVLSYVLLRGRCRHCDVPISPLYPAVELVSAALIVACFAVFGLTAWAALAAAFCAVLVALSAMESEHSITPDRIVVPAAAVALVAHAVIDPSLAWLECGLATAAVLLLLVLACPDRVGMGHVKLGVLLGAVLGASVAVALTLGLFAALVTGRKTAVAIVPYLSFGAVVALFFGDAIVGAYRGLF